MFLFIINIITNLNIINQINVMIISNLGITFINVKNISEILFNKYKNEFNSFFSTNIWE
jgi:hypothetical protein